MRAGLAAMMAALAGTAAHAQVDTWAAMPRIRDAQLSPDGTRLATGCAPRGVKDICIYDLDTDRRWVVASPEDGRINGFFWPNSQFLIYEISAHQTVTTSSEVHRITVSRTVSYNLDNQRSVLLLDGMHDLAAPNRIVSMLTGDDERIAVEARFFNRNYGDNDARVASRHAFDTRVYEINLVDGHDEDELYRSEGNTLRYVLDDRGRAVLDIRYDDMTGVYSIWRAGESAAAPLYSAEFPEDIPHVRGFADGGSAVAVEFPEAGIRRLDLQTGELSDLEGFGPDTLYDPALLVDSVSRELVGEAAVTDYPVQYFTDPELAQLQAELAGILTEDSVVLRSWSQDRRKFIIVGQGLGQPANYYLLDLDSGELGLIDTEFAVPEGAGVGRRSSVSYETRDGLEIQAWLTQPDGAQPGTAPLIVMPHGGPERHDTAGFDWQASYYASLGYAVFQPNYRGSTGRGEDFVEAGHGEFGTGMIYDIMDGVRYLQSEGLVRSDGYCAIGSSYGGYAALMLALEDSGQLRCAITYGAVTAPFALMSDLEVRASTLDYWENYIGSRFDDADYQAAITPVERAGEFNRPLLLVHGDEDTTVTPGQWRLLRREMGRRGVARFVMLDGENHYLDTQTSREAFLRESTDFLAEHFPATPR